MKLIALLSTAATLLLFACNDNSVSNNTVKNDSGGAPTSDQTAVKKVEAPAVVLDSATKAKNMMDYGTPSDFHKMMAKWDGTWDAALKYWIDPAMPPMTMNLKTTNKMILNGLYQQSTSTGSMNGMPFNGVSTTGYDNHRKMVTSTWVDNMSSGIMYLEGTWDEATKSMTLKGKVTDPETKEQHDMREVMKIVDDNTQVMEQYITRNGKEVKALEITFKRHK